MQDLLQGRPLAWVLQVRLDPSSSMAALQNPGGRFPVSIFCTLLCFLCVCKSSRPAPPPSSAPSPNPLLQEGPQAGVCNADTGGKNPPCSPRDLCSPHLSDPVSLPPPPLSLYNLLNPPRQRLEVPLSSARHKQGFKFASEYIFVLRSLLFGLVIFGFVGFFSVWQLLALLFHPLK